MKTKSRSSRLHQAAGQKPERSRRERGFILLCVALWCLLSSVFAHSFLYSSVEVIGRSMAPTLHPGDWRLVNRWRHRLLGVERGDLVVLREPRTSTAVVKRIIGLPGDTVQFRPDGVYVNHRKLEEPYLSRNTYTWSQKMNSSWLSVGDGHYFVMGDNRLFSIDSRWYGPVPQHDLVGILSF